MILDARLRPSLSAMPEDLGSPAARQRLHDVVDLMRDMSASTDPKIVVERYGARARTLFQNDGLVSISRRDMPPGTLRITRFSGWDTAPDPWKERDRQPVITGGVLVDLLYADRPTLINDFRCPPDDPAYEFLSKARAIAAIPHYDGGVGLNMVVSFRHEPHTMDPEKFPEFVWMSNLFGRSVKSLVLARQVSEAHDALDREARVVADIQRALLPAKVPDVPGLRFATYYQTSKNAGGDYFDFFDLPDGRVGLLIADVSGHGTPAAVLMAIMHAIAHVGRNEPGEPGKMLSSINDELTSRYTASESIGGMFVTAFYGVYDPRDRSLRFASAGHNPPRLRVGFAGTRGPVLNLDQARGLPLGVVGGWTYEDFRVELDAGDAIVFYTDGITEAFNARREMYGTERMDAILAHGHADAQALLKALLDDVARFTGETPPNDDRTIIVATAHP